MSKHGRLIDADALEKDGWMMHRTVQVDSNTMEYQTKKPTDFSTSEPERETGEWIDYIGKDLGIEGQWLRDDGKTVFIQCNKCDSLYVRNFMIHPNFCPNCGAKMSGGKS